MPKKKKDEKIPHPDIPHGAMDANEFFTLTQGMSSSTKESKSDEEEERRKDRMEFFKKILAALGIFLLWVFIPIILFAGLGEYQVCFAQSARNGLSIIGYLVSGIYIHRLIAWKWYSGGSPLTFSEKSGGIILGFLIPITLLALVGIIYVTDWSAPLECIPRNTILRN